MSVGMAELKPVYESVTLPELTETLRQVFRTADQAIVMLAVQSADNHEQNRHFESAQQLRIIHRSMMQRFVDHWFAPLFAKPVCVDADAEHIASLRKLMSQAVVLEDAISPTDLLNPAHIHNSFLYSLAEADLDVHSKMLVLRAFETRLQDDLPAFREKASAALNEIGIKAQLVELKPAVIAPSHVEGSGHLAVALADLQAMDYEVLENRLSPEVLLAFTPPNNARDLLAEMKAAKLLTAEISADEQHILHDIRQLFAIIQADQRLSAPARALLSYLQLPYSRIALHDAAFFTDEKNLAKSLLNETVRLAANWQPNSEQLALDPFCQKLSDMVTTFWEAERVGQIPYQQMLFDLLLYGESERQLQQVTSRRFQESQQGALQASLIREQVDALVDTKFQHIKMPQAVEQLLEEGWKHVLYLAGLRFGVDSDDWQIAADVLDQLADTLQPPDYYPSRTSFLIRLPSLLRKLREGLLFIQLAPAVINQLFADLEAEHKKLALRIRDSELDDDVLEAARREAQNMHLSLGQSVAQPVSLASELPVIETLVIQDVPQAAMSVSAHQIAENTAVVVEEKAVAESIVVEEVVEPIDPERQLAMDKLAGLGQGSLIVWNKESGQERCRIAAFIKHTRKYILTGRGGVKVAEWSYDEMLEKLLNGELETIETGQIFERALESVIGRMRDTR